tara:strand:+ start:37637 stop:37939 length:303 start_codon:yes stop_codon:yes gene_type:complete
MIANAEGKTEQAEESRYALLANISDESTKAKAKLLAEDAIAGVKVSKVAMALAAESDDAACAQAFSRCNSTRASARATRLSARVEGNDSSRIRHTMSPCS